MCVGAALPWDGASSNVEECFYSGSMRGPGSDGRQVLATKL